MAKVSRHCCVRIAKSVGAKGSFVCDARTNDWLILFWMAGVNEIIRITAMSASKTNNLVFLYINNPAINPTVSPISAPVEQVQIKVRIPKTVIRTFKQISNVFLSVSRLYKVKKTTGKLGEKIASNFLQKNGYSIIDRNFKVKFGEIDIIASKDDVIHIIEVKTKTSDDKGFPYEQVNSKKLKNLIRLTSLYTKYKNIKDSKLSIDIVSILLDKNSKYYDIKLFENITN